MSNKFWFILRTATFLSLVTGTSMAQAVETFSVDNVALNTNWNFTLIDGNPRMSIYQRNDNDPDQQFDRLQGNRGGILLKHRSTGRCLNAYNPSVGSEINVWPCDANDLDQNWNLVPVSDGRILIQRTGTNFCVDAPTRDNEGKVHLQTCDGNNQNQRWQSSAYVPPTGNSVIIQPETTSLAYERGQEWTTSNQYKFVFQNDGNLVLYSPQGQALWATGTNQTTADVLGVQTDGNVVLYDQGRPVWATDTAGNPGAFLAIQTDGNIVVYSSNNVPLFDTGTVGGQFRTLTASADWLNKSKLSYYPNIESVLRNFFINPANTNNENWSQKTITEMWDRVGGESAQFPGGTFTPGDIWQVDMPSEAYGVYQDLSNTIFGYVQAVSTGYAYDYGYYLVHGAHSALDISASNGTSLKAVVNGTVVDNRPHYLKNGDFNGYWIAIDELDGNGQKTGRRWWYGHLATINVNVGSPVTAGQTVLGTVGQGHLHLGVVSTYKSYTTSRYGVEVSNGQTGNYSADVQDVLNRTMSPLQAYWNSRNGIKE